MKDPGRPGLHPSIQRDLGFTVLEALTALMVLSVLVRLGLPIYQGVRLETQAAQIAADITAVQAAVSEYRSEHSSWPRDLGPGIVPPELVPYLDGLPFNRGPYRLDWQNWALPDGLPDHPGTRAVLAVSVVTEDRALGVALLELLGPTAKHFAIGDSYTFILDAN